MFYINRQSLLKGSKALNIIMALSLVGSFQLSASAREPQPGLTPEQVRAFAQSDLNLDSSGSARVQLAIQDLVSLLSGEASSVLENVVLTLKTLAAEPAQNGGCDLKSPGQNQNSVKAVETAEFAIVHIKALKSEGLGSLTGDEVLARAAADPICSPQSGIASRLNLGRLSSQIQADLKGAVAELNKSLEAEKKAREEAVTLLSNQLKAAEAKLVQHDSQLKAQSDLLAAQGKTLGEHTQALDDHRLQLVAHASTLSQHGATLNQHGATLNQHAATLNQHGEKLNQHSATLAAHTITLQAHSARMDGIDARITAEVKALDLRLVKAEEWILDYQWKTRTLPRMDPPKGGEVIAKPRPPYNPPRPDGWTPPTP